MPCRSDHREIVPYESKTMKDGVFRYMAVCLDCDTTLCRPFQEYSRSGKSVNIKINGHIGHYEVWVKNDEHLY